MGYDPQAQLCYGLEVPEEFDLETIGDPFEPIDGCALCVYGYHPFGYILAVNESIVGSYIDFNLEIEQLPIFKEEWTGILKDCCTKFNIPYSEPKWHLLAAYV